jgi:alkylation response protein AidB-like acyl-CoA dehydrogenase
VTAHFFAPDDVDAIDAAVQDIVDSVIAPDAERVDVDGVFPAPGLAALGQAGLLGLTSAREVGG